MIEFLTLMSAIIMIIAAMYLIESIAVHFLDNQESDDDEKTD